MDQPIPDVLACSRVSRSLRITERTHEPVYVGMHGLHMLLDLQASGQQFVICHLELVVTRRLRDSPRRHTLDLHVDRFVEPSTRPTHRLTGFVGGIAVLTQLNNLLVDRFLDVTVRKPVGFSSLRALHKQQEDTHFPIPPAKLEKTSLQNLIFRIDLSIELRTSILGLNSSARKVEVSCSGQPMGRPGSTL